MNKLPIVMSNLMLLSAGTSLPMDLLQSEAPLNDVVAQTEELSLDVNPYYPSLQFVKITRTGSVGFRARTLVQNGQSYRLTNIGFATLNYEGGWSQKQADKLILDWKEAGKPEWAKEYGWNPVTMNTDAVSMTMPFRGSGTSSYDMLSKNLIDLLYFSAKLTNISNPEAEPIWLQGKLDYRGCAHAKEFTKDESVVCETRIDESTNTISFVAMLGTTEVGTGSLSWADEWTQALLDKLAFYDTVFDQYEGEDVKAPEWQLKSAEQNIEKIEGQIGDDISGDEVREKAEALRKRIADLRAKNARLEAAEKEPEGGEGEGEGEGTGGGEGEGEGEGGTGSGEGEGGGNGEGTESGNGDGNEDGNEGGYEGSNGEGGTEGEGETETEGEDGNSDEMGNSGSMSGTGGTGTSVGGGNTGGFGSAIGNLTSSLGGNTGNNTESNMVANSDASTDNRVVANANVTSTANMVNTAVGGSGANSNVGDSDNSVRDEPTDDETSQDELNKIAEVPSLGFGDKKEEISEKTGGKGWFWWILVILGVATTIGVAIQRKMNKNREDEC